MLRPAVQYSARRLWLLALTGSLGMLVLGINGGLRVSEYNYMRGEGISNLSYRGFNIGAIVGGAASGFVANKYGRRKALMGFDLLVLLGACMNISTESYVFILGQFFCGVSSLGLLGVGTHYIREMCPSRSFSRIGPVIQLQLAHGTLLAHLVALTLTFRGFDSVLPLDFWRYMTLVQIPVAVLQFCLLWKVFRFDTPYSLWCRYGGMYALRSLQYIYKGQAAIDLIDNSAITDNVEQVMMGDDYFGFGYEKWTVASLLTFYSKKMRVALFLTFFHVSLGYNIFTSSMFSIYVLSDWKYRILLISLATVNVVSVYFSFYFIQRFKRRAVFIVSNLLMSAIAITIGMVVVFHQTEYLFVGFLSTVYLFAFGAGAGTLFRIYLGETLAVRSTGACLAIGWFISTVISILPAPYPPIYLLIFSGVMSLLCAVYVKLDLLETKGLSHYEIFMKLR